jgi:dihydrofolate synthase/folylpolyglutamate synthase
LADKSLDQWLQEIESNHPVGIDMGLSRCAQVLSNLDINFDKKLVITVAGTNGKGTTCAFIEQYCLLAGLSVGVFSSPHILSFCERIRLNGENISEDALCSVFEHIHQSKKEITLTYFEYATLAAFEAFNREQPDVLILEVGLGGRLDAVNIVDPDIAVITSIGLDHQDWLGDTREEIGFEKAGIFRPHAYTVIGEPDCPKSILSHADTLGVSPMLRGRDFNYCEIKQEARVGKYNFDVSLANIPKQNVATGLAAIALMNKHEKLKVAVEQKGVATIDLADLFANKTRFDSLLCSTQLVGRHQVIQSRINGQQALIIADVAHNEDSALQLRKMIASNLQGKCHIVIGMLKDKNIEVSIKAFEGLTTIWYCATLPSERGESAARLVKAASNLSETSNTLASSDGFDTVEQAFLKAKTEAYPQDTILVMGSFLTVSAVMSLLSDA